MHSMRTNGKSATDNHGPSCTHVSQQSGISYFHQGIKLDLKLDLSAYVTSSDLQEDVQHAWIP